MLSQANNNVVKKFIYLMVVDLVRLPLNHKYADYVKEEPGYAQAWLKAYLQAFSHPKTGKVTHERIKEIHKIATSHLKDVNSGDYRKIEGNLALYPSYMYIPEAEVYANNISYTMTEKGLLEFIFKWFVKEKDIVHTIEFASMDPNGLNHFLMLRNGKLQFLTANQKGEQIASKTFNFAEDANKFTEMVASGKYNVTINTMFYDDNPSVLHAKVTAKMQLLFDNFHQNMEKVKNESDIKKVTVIVELIQNINQLHPFRDGNIRTCYILLNALLRDFDLRPTLLLNPNVLDACDQALIVKHVIDGQQYFQKVFENESDKPIIETNEKFKETKQFLFEPNYLYDVAEGVINQFITAVIKPQGSVESTPGISQVNNDFSFFTLNSPPQEELLQKVEECLGTKSHPTLIKAIKDGDYGLALRNACANAKGSNAKALMSIIHILIDFKDRLNIELNGQSLKSGGKTALDWLHDLDPKTDAVEQLIQLLRSKGALRQNELHITTPERGPH